MHAIFIPYGKRSEVNLLLRDMEAQKHLLKFSKGDEEKKVWIESQIRVLPFGIYEYIFPKEDIDVVLNTLNFKSDETIGRFEIGKLKKWLLKTLLKCEKIPKYKEERKYLWLKDNVNIIPLGIRHDAEDLIEIAGEHEGWIHEAI